MMLTLKSSVTLGVKVKTHTQSQTEIPRRPRNKERLRERETIILTFCTLLVSNVETHFLKNFFGQKVEI